MNEFKIHKTTGGVIHSGSWMGNEADPKTSKYGYFTPSCGSGVVYAMGSLRNIAGFREAKADAEVTCKRCLKLIAKQTQERAIEQRRAEARASIAATRRKTNDAKSKPAKRHTFEYSATQGVIIAAALRQQAAEEELQANIHEQNGTGYEDQARTARNRAKMLVEAADEMHSTVQNALRQEDPMHKRIQDSIGLYW